MFPDDDPVHEPVNGWLSSGTDEFSDKLRDSSDTGIHRRFFTDKIYAEGLALFDCGRSGEKNGDAGIGGSQDLGVLDMIHVCDDLPRGGDGTGEGEFVYVLRVCALKDGSKPGGQVDGLSPNNDFVAGIIMVSNDD